MDEGEDIMQTTKKQLWKEEDALTRLFVLLPLLLLPSDGRPAFRTQIGPNRADLNQSGPKSTVTVVTAVSGATRYELLANQSNPERQYIDR